MSESKYLFRREDNGEIVAVPWEMMIDQEYGFITLPDGVSARRVSHLEKSQGCKKVKNEFAEGKEIVSDSLGFTEAQLCDFENDRVAHGFTGIEFRRDPTENTFIQVCCKSRNEFNRYMAHRGFVNKSSFGGVRLSQEDLDKAKELVERVHGVA